VSFLPVGVRNSRRGPQPSEISHDFRDGRLGVRSRGCAAPHARHSLGAHRVRYLARHARRIERHRTNLYANMTTFSRAGLAAAATRASPGIAPRETRDAARCAYVARETRATSRGGRTRLGASRGGSRPVRALLGDQEVRSPPARHPSTRAASLSRATSPSRDHRRGARSHLPEDRAVSRGKSWRRRPSAWRRRARVNVPVDRAARRRTRPAIPGTRPDRPRAVPHRVHHPPTLVGIPPTTPPRARLPRRRAARFPAADHRDSSSLPPSRVSSPPLPIRHVHAG